MRTIFEGLPEEIPSGWSLAQLIEAKGEDTVHLLAEVNHRYVHRKDYPATLLAEGDRVELIHPAFGG
jgi:thiamine biosynthesis protein ThiS